MHTYIFTQVWVTDRQRRFWLSRVRGDGPFTRTYVHTYIHTYVYTYIHTYMHTYIRSPSVIFPGVSPYSKNVRASPYQHMHQDPALRSPYSAAGSYASEAPLRDGAYSPYGRDGEWSMCFMWQCVYKCIYTWRERERCVYTCVRVVMWTNSHTLNHSYI